MLLGAGSGFYWLIPAVLAGLVGGVINAWLFLLRVPGGTGRPGGTGAPEGAGVTDAPSAGRDPALS